MIVVTIGADSYGRVKSVDGTPVVTKFGMLSGLPIWPICSYYRYGGDMRSLSGIPLVFHLENVLVHGLPLSRIDRLSVAMAYLRGLAGAMILFGSMAGGETASIS